jgi:hypothetical protein
MLPPRPDPLFSPNDPSVNYANYPQPPNSSFHNQSPNPGKTEIEKKKKKKKKKKNENKEINYYIK